MDRIINNFTYHAPKGNQPERYEAIRAAGRQLSLVILANCPVDSREKSYALKKVDEAVMWANAGIARNE